MIGSTCLGDSGNNKDCEVDGFSFLNNSNIEIILFGISPLIKKKRFGIWRGFWEDGRIGRTRNLCPHLDNNCTGGVSDTTFFFF